MTIVNINGIDQIDFNLLGDIAATTTDGSTSIVETLVSGQNQVFATPDGASGGAALRPLQTGDLPATGVFTTLSTEHLITVGINPSIAAGAGSGTSPTVNVTGTDTTGAVTITTGTGCGANASLADITFSVGFGVSPRILLQPANALTAALSGSYAVFPQSSTVGFSILSNSTALPDSTGPYVWTYFVIQEPYII